MDLLNAAERASLLANGARMASGVDGDPAVVARILLPDAGASWLLAATDPGDPDLVYCVALIDDRSPEVQWTRLSTIARLRGALGLPPERDPVFAGAVPLSEALASARAVDRSEGP